MDFAQDLWQNFVDTALGLLPLSPVAEFTDYFSSLPYLGYINWFVPVGACVSIFAVWLACIAGYYLVSIILRWARVIA